MGIIIFECLIGPMNKLMTETETETSLTNQATTDILIVTLYGSHVPVLDQVRYREDVKTISPNGGELESKMEQGIRVEVKSRTFDKPAKMKLKVNPR